MVTAWAVLVGGFGALAAIALLRLIGLITNPVFYQRWQATLVTPGVGHRQADTQPETWPRDHSTAAYGKSQAGNGHGK